MHILQGLHVAIVLRSYLYSPLISELALDEKKEYSKLQTKDWDNHRSTVMNGKRVKLVHVLLIIRELGRHSFVASERTEQRIESMKAMLGATDKGLWVFDYLWSWLENYEGHGIGEPPENRWTVELKDWRGLSG